MKSEHKALALLGTWLMIGVLAGVVLTNFGLGIQEEWVIAAVTGIFALLLISMTAIITVATPTIASDKSADSRAARGLSKAKNSDTALVDRLIATMSEEELAALRRRLSAPDSAEVGDDGEVISLEDAIRGKRR